MQIAHFVTAETYVYVPPLFSIKDINHIRVYSIKFKHID